jgi:hypothetical protein
MSVPRQVPRFPAVAFVSRADFLEYRREAQERLDARHVFESSLTTYDDALVRPGTCAPCLRPTVYATPTSGWVRRPDGRRSPDWSDGLFCDCTDRLGGRARAILHAAQALGGLRPTTRLLLFGPPHACHRRLAPLAGEAQHLRALTAAADGYRLDTGQTRFHLAVAADCLHRVPPLEAAFAALAGALLPGGALLFTVPFRAHDAATRSRDDLHRPDGRLPVESAEVAHELGWDVLARLRQAGFARASAHGYWSAELGYLGPFNMIFHAVV